MSAPSHTNGDVTGHHGRDDYWVVKLDSTGEIEWQKSLGGTNQDVANSIQQTFDGGYIVAGSTKSDDEDVSDLHGDFSFEDYWVVKLDSTGKIEWEKTLGLDYPDYAYSINQTFDSGYIVAGTTLGTSGNVTLSDFLIVKLKSDGTVQWEKRMEESSYQEARYIQQTFDSGYIICGYTTVVWDSICAGGYNYDYWVVKLDTSGSVQWQKTFGGSCYDEASSVQQTSDSGYIIAGFSNSSSGDITGNHGGYDYWIIKLDSSGTLQWEKSLGGSTNEYAYSVKQTKDDGYIIAGHTNSNDGDVSGNHSFLSYDFWLVKLDSIGTVQWQKCLGGTGNEGTFPAPPRTTAQPTFDGGYIIAGMSNSNDGDVSGNHPVVGSAPSIDMWVVKLGPAVLPLTLLSFNADRYNKNVEITWKVANEINTKDFAIERSINGTNWTTIGSVYATGAGNNDYTYTDKNPLNGINYYRLKMNDKDGKFTYSPVRTVEFSKNANLTIIPNPADNKVTLYFGSNAKVSQIVVSDMKGREVQRQQMTGNTNSYSIRTNQLPEGTYLIRVQLEKGIITRKLVVVH